MPNPSIWTVTGLLDYFQETDDTPDRRFAFILGAGASVQSGIPMAGHLVDSWLRELHAREDHERRPLAQWATAEALGIAGFVHARAVESYPQVFARRFAGRPDEGHAYLERILHGKDPSFGYSVLAQILANTRHRVVITTNFDNLVADALAIYTNQLPFVCGHESLAGFVRPNPRRPLVVKIHRDLLLAPKNTSDEIAALPDPLVSSLRGLLAGFTPIVVGYGGNDGSLMGLLRDTLQPGDIPGGIYWCYWAGGGLPGPAITEVVQRHGGALIPIAGFDELMVQLNHRLGYPRMDQRIEQRARERAQRYRQSFEALHARVLQTEVVLADDDDNDDELDAHGDDGALATDEARAAGSETHAPAATEDRPDMFAGGPATPEPSRAASPRPAPSSTPRSPPPATSAASTDRSDAPPTRSGTPRGPVPSTRPVTRSGARRDEDQASSRRAPTPTSPAQPPAAQLRSEPAIVSSSTAAPAPPQSMASAVAREAMSEAEAPRHATTPAPGASASTSFALETAAIPLQQAVQALVSDGPVEDDWWTLKLHADQLEKWTDRIAAYRAAVACFPDQRELRRGLACELAVANLSDEAREIFRDIERTAPNDPQVHLDLASLYLYWGAGKTQAEPRARVAWRLAVAASHDAPMLAAVAFVRGLIARRDDRDDTTALRVLHGLLPVLAVSLQPLAPVIARIIHKRLDQPGQQLYHRLLACLQGKADVQTLQAIDRWTALTPLAPEAAWPDDAPVRSDS